MNSSARRNTKKVSAHPRRFNPARMLEYLGVVNYGTTERVLEEIRALYIEAPEEEIVLTVTSPGGPSGTAMGFHDHIQRVLKPNLTTIASGDVDSSGIILFLSGDRRYVTPNTTLLLHRAGRTFEGGKRITADELDAMLREDRLKDFQYASVVADRSGSRLTSEKVLSLMDANTILTPTDLVAYGLADEILS